MPTYFIAVGPFGVPVAKLRLEETDQPAFSLIADSARTGPNGELESLLIDGYHHTLPHIIERINQGGIVANVQNFLNAETLGITSGSPVR